MAADKTVYLAPNLRLRTRRISIASLLTRRIKKQRVAASENTKSTIVAVDVRTANAADDPEWPFAAPLPTQEKTDRFSFDPPDVAKLIPENSLFNDV